MKYFLVALLISAVPVIAGDDILQLFPTYKPVPGHDQMYQSPEGKQFDIDQLVERALNTRVAQLEKSPNEETMRNLLALYLRFGQDSELFLPALKNAQTKYPALFEQVVKSLTKDQRTAVVAGMEAANEL